MYINAIIICVQRRAEMQIYKDMYYFLFNAVTDAFNELPEDPDKAKLILMLAQIKCEKMFVENEEN